MKLLKRNAIKNAPNRLTVKVSGAAQMLLEPRWASKTLEMREISAGIFGAALALLTQNAPNFVPQFPTTLKSDTCFLFCNFFSLSATCLSSCFISNSRAWASLMPDKTSLMAFLVNGLGKVGVDFVVVVESSAFATEL